MRVCLVGDVKTGKGKRPDVLISFLKFMYFLMKLFFINTLNSNIHQIMSTRFCSNNMLKLNWNLILSITVYKNEIYRLKYDYSVVHCIPGTVFAMVTWFL